jgi:hypothetical protein
MPAAVADRHAAGCETRGRAAGPPRREARATPRTGSGAVFESLIVPVLQRNAYGYLAQQSLAPNLGGGRQRVDGIILRPDGTKVLLSLKWQDGAGSAEEKVPCEVIKLILLLDAHPDMFARAYLVIGGKGFSSRLRDFYLSGGLRHFIRRADDVRVVDLEQFVALANGRAL